jgi:hypothetical protein
MNRFIDDLMKKMTLEEKIGQLNLPVTGEITTGQAKSSNVAKRIRAGEVGGLFNLKGVERIRDVQKQAVEESRLGIPLLFGMDVIHGYETVFPIPLGLSCTWDMKAVEESARIAAIESSADGICWTFSPMVDICRDARWGRVSEGNGEDPFLGAAIAQAMVRGYQGKDMSRNDEIMACVKHFALYGAGVDVDVALDAGDAELLEQGHQIHPRQGGVADEVDPDVAVDGVTLFGAGLGLDLGGETEVGAELEAGGQGGQHLHGGGGGYHVVGVTGKLHPVVALDDDGVLAPLGRGQRGGLGHQRKESTKTNQQPLHRIL